MQVRQKYGTVNAGSVCKATPRVYDMKEYMDLPLGDHAKTEDALKGKMMAQGNGCITLLSQSLEQAQIQTIPACILCAGLDSECIFIRRLRQVRRRTIAAALQDVCSLKEVQISFEVAHCSGTKAEHGTSAQA